MLVVNRERTLSRARLRGQRNAREGGRGAVSYTHLDVYKRQFQILRGLDMPPDEVACVVSAIGQHDEKTGTAVDPVSAAVILADKSDVRRNRVRNRIKATFDKHDRVNYAAVSAALEVLPEKKTVQLDN